MKFSIFAQKLSELEGMSSRTLISTEYSRLIGLCSSKEEVYMAVTITTGRISPKHTSLEFNFAQKQLLKTLQHIYLDIEEKYKDVGDIGSAIETSREIGSIYGESLGQGTNLQSMFEELYTFASITGAGSNERKAKMLLQMLLREDNVSRKWITRIILGSMRLGLSEKGIIDAISIYLVGDKSCAESIEKAVGVRSDIAEIASLICDWKSKLSLEEIKANLLSLKVKLFTPVASKLVERVKDELEIIERMKVCFVQPKFDGLRIQAHFNVDRVEFYSRNMENNTAAYPDLVDALKSFAKLNGLESAIFDGEVVGYDQVSHKPLPFQDTSKRRRKSSNEERTSEIPVVYNVFDVLFENGVDMTASPIEERLLKLRSYSWTASILLTQTDKVSETESLRQLFDRYVRIEGQEGVIAKELSTPYDPGTRNFDWVKLKRSADSNLNDSTDLVVLGYYLGKGKRAGIGIGGILCGTYDKHTQKFYTVCKVGTGFSDEQLRMYLVKLDTLVSAKQYNQENSEIATSLQDGLITVEPKIVVEIEADEITASELHSAKYSLRFPRIKNWNRDKSFEQVTTIKELARMFEIRKGIV